MVDVVRHTLKYCTCVEHVGEIDTTRRRVTVVLCLGTVGADGRGYGLGADGVEERWWRASGLVAWWPWKLD